jgi:hypothetical protein
VADGHEPVVGAPLPVDLPRDVLAAAPVAREDPPEPEPERVRTAVPTAGLLEAAVDPDSPSTDAPPGDAADAGDAGDAADESDTFVERIRELAELYRSGALDDEEFAAAKAIVLRSPNR